MLVIFSGGSGVGKNTVIERLLALNDFALMPTCTTRKRREGESEGHPYRFLTEEEFLALLSQGEFYEHQLVHDHYYGTSRSLLRESMKTGKILLKDIDVLGTKNLLQTVGKDIRIVTFFLKVDSVEELRRRLEGRGEREIDLRLNRYSLEQQYEIDYDYVVTNNDLEETIENVKTAIFAEWRNAFPQATVPFDSLDLGYVEELARAFSGGARFPAVKLARNGDSLCIVKGHHKYLAALRAGVNVAKEIVEEPIPDLPDQKEWLFALRECQKKERR